MNGDKKEKSTSETLGNLIGLLTAREEAQSLRDQVADKRAEKTDLKMDTLVESINTLTISHTESQKDNKTIFKTIDRVEATLIKVEEKLIRLGEVSAVHEEKLNSSKGKWKMLGAFAVTVGTTLLLVKLT